jgi:hypothetical protein
MDGVSPESPIAAVKRNWEPCISSANCFTKVAVARLEIFTSGSANQPLDDAHDPPGAWPPTRAVRTKRALRSAPVVLVRGVRVPAFAETGASLFIEHGLRILPVRKA